MGQGTQGPRIPESPIAEDDRGEAARFGLSDAEVRQAMEAAGVGLWVFDVTADRVTWSSSMCRIAGVDPSDFPRDYAQWRELVHPEDLGRVESMVQEAMSRGEYPDMEHRLLRPDGEVRHVLAKGAVERSEDGRPLRIIGSVVDVTDRRELESRIREDMRLESLGRLAGGIAHDFNNMLTVILGSANLALDLLVDADGPVADNLIAIREAAERSATLTAQLLAFARRHASLPRQADLAALIERGLPLVGHLVGPAVRVVADLDPPVPLEVDPSQFQQLFMNLAANARDAMPGGGVLVIRARLEARGRRAVARMELEVTGSGIPPEVMPRVFEPFFSTKGPLGGAGLGLATVYGIVRQHGGHVHIHSEPGRGTRVTIEWPAAVGARVASTGGEDASASPWLPLEGAQASPLGASGPESPPEPPDGGLDRTAQRPAPPSPEAPVRPWTRQPGWLPARALILLVDDEPRVRAVTSTLLGRLGHEVVEANDGVEALALAAVRPPDLVVTDLVMPRLGGAELIRALRDGRPRLPAIVMTGFGGALPGDGDWGSAVLPADVTCIAKPFHPDQLAERVTTLLSERALGEP